MQDVRGKLGTPRCGKRVRGLAWAARGVGGRAGAPRKASVPLGLPGRARCTGVAFARNQGSSPAAKGLGPRASLTS